jgi:hypothetical protein
MSRLARLMSRSLKDSPLLPLPSTSRFDRFDKPRHGCCSVGHRGHQALASHATPNSNVTIARRIQQNMSSVFSTCKYIRSLAKLAKRDPFVPLRSFSTCLNCLFGQMPRMPLAFVTLSVHQGPSTSGTSSASTPVRCTTASATPRSCGSDFA